jgi:hypothetical protein
MSKVFLFVHGTGVRTDDYRRSFLQVQAGLRGQWPGARVEPCSWGEKVGATLARGGISIPDFSGEAPPTDEQAALAVLWDLLAVDPDFEWRELAGAPAGGFVDAAQRLAAEQFSARVAALGSLPAALSRIPVADDDTASRDSDWQQACLAASGSQAMVAALDALKRVDGRVRRAAARACVAQHQWRQAFARGGALPASTRDALVDALFNELGGADAGRVVDWVTARFRHGVKRWATDKARRERDVLFNAAYPAAGDILRYQARGEAIRREIAARIDACGDDVVVLAHSLGGIACVDLLVMEPRPQVRALVTFGSQAPLLYELGALQSLAPPDKLPRHFPGTWLNFYDRDDLLSYVAAPLFSPVARDVPVRSGTPFPDAHSAYWTQPDVWERLEQLLP